MSCLKYKAVSNLTAHSVSMEATWKAHFSADYPSFLTVLEGDEVQIFSYSCHSGTFTKVQLPGSSCVRARPHYLENRLSLLIELDDSENSKCSNDVSGESRPLTMSPLYSYSLYFVCNKYRLTSKTVKRVSSGDGARGRSQQNYNKTGFARRSIRIATNSTENFGAAIRLGA